MLGRPEEHALVGHGISTCATCDGFFFRDQDIMVVGGGDSALEEALFLARLGRQVAVVHRRDTLRASKIMQERARTNPKISFIWDSGRADRRSAPRQVTAVTLRNLKTEEVERKVDGLFAHRPHAQHVAARRPAGAAPELPREGRARHHPHLHLASTPRATSSTSPGARQHRRRHGCMAALEAERYLDGIEPQG
jgi:thioredoxin reductase (NADPH)